MTSDVRNVFLFLLDHPTLEPRHFIDEKVVNDNHHDYMFLECIKFINEVKNNNNNIFMNLNVIYKNGVAVETMKWATAA